MLNVCIEICYEKKRPNVWLFLVGGRKYRVLSSIQLFDLFQKGLSGSGKTESCKYIVQHILSRSLSHETALNMKINQVKINPSVRQVNIFLLD